MRVGPSLALGMTVLLASTSAAQKAATPSTKAASKAPPTAKTTWSGVYTTAQAARGRRVYLGACKYCHTPESHTGKTFERFWNGKTVGDLYDFMSTNMPKSDPGSLDADAYADVIAYILQMNAMPAGKTELYADYDTLSTIKILSRHPAAARTSIPVKKPTHTKE